MQANFITANTYKCVELNAHALIIALIISRDNFAGRCCFMPWLFGSQSSEEAFRSVRSMSGVFSPVINFGMLGLLRQLHRLDLLSRLEAESKETGIINPDQARKINKMAKETRIRVIPYQFTKLLHMTPSELNEIWSVGSSSGLMYPKGISPKFLVWLPRNALLNIFSFCSFAMHIFIQNIITYCIEKWFAPL